MQRRSPKKRQTTSTLVMKIIFVDDKRTSARLEPAMWNALDDIRRRKKISLSELISQIAHQRSSSSLTAAIRVYIVEFYRSHLETMEKMNMSS